MDGTSILQEELTLLRIECDSLKSQITIFKNEIEIHKSETTQLKQINDDLHIANNMLQHTNQHLTQLLESYDKDESRDKLTKLSSNNKDLFHNVSEQKQNIQHMNEINARLTQEIEQYLTKINQLELERNEMMDNHYTLEVEQNIIITQLENRIQDLEFQLSSKPVLEEKESDNKPLIHRTTLRMNAIPSNIDRIKPDFNKRNSPAPTQHLYQFSNNLFSSLFKAQQQTVFEADVAALEIVNDNINIYEKMEKEYEAKLSQQRDEYEAIQAKIKSLLDNMNTIKLQNTELKKQIHSLKKRNTELSNNNNKLFWCI